MITRPAFVALASLAAASSLVAPRASADTIKLASLPTGQVTQHPSGAPPKHIGAGERVPGFFLAKPPAEKQLPGMARVPFVVVFSNDKDARSLSQGKGMGLAMQDRPDTCFAQRAVDLDIDENGGPAEWSPSLEPFAQLAPHFSRSPKKKNGKASPADVQRTFEVTAVHQERFVDGGGRAQLEMIDAWVDPTSGGVRLIGKATLPLQKIGDAPGGIVLYAAHERTHVQIVVRRPREADDDATGGSPDMAQLRRAQMREMPLFVESSNGSRDASMCGFARVTLHAEQGVGEMARLETSILTTSPPEEQPAKRESALQAMLGEGDAAQDLTQPEMKIRPLSINLSTSWLTRDKEPVVSVTLGWAGRERKM